jgi:hypothetical protein
VAWKLWVWIGEDKEGLEGFVSVIIGYTSTHEILIIWSVEHESPFDVS